MIEVTVKTKTIDDKRPKVFQRFREDGPGDPMEEALKVVREFWRSPNLDKIRIDIEFNADCGCIQG